MEIIDFDRKGNLIRFYLGEKSETWGWTDPNYKDWIGKTPDWLKPSDTYYGDDWNDTPYEHNAGSVYNEFVKGHFDVSLPFEWYVLEPSDGEWNSHWCKDDMVARRVPCLIIIPDKCLDTHDCFIDSFKDWVGRDGVIRVYFGDTQEDVRRRISDASR